MVEGFSSHWLGGGTRQAKVRTSKQLNAKNGLGSISWAHRRVHIYTWINFKAKKGQNFFICFFLFHKVGSLNALGFMVFLQEMRRIWDWDPNKEKGEAGLNPFINANWVEESLLRYRKEGALEQWHVAYFSSVIWGIFDFCLLGTWNFQGFQTRYLNI